MFRFGSLLLPYKRFTCSPTGWTVVVGVLQVVHILILGDIKLVEVDKGEMPLGIKTLTEGQLGITGPILVY